MSDLLLAFLTGGSGLLVGSGLTLWHKCHFDEEGRDRRGAAAKPLTVEFWEVTEPALCGVADPDGRLRCTEGLGHCGWHRAERASWWGASWACNPHSGADDVTASSAATTSAEAAAATAARAVRRPFLSFPLGPNPSESDVSVARFVERWINGFTIGSTGSPHRSQPAFYRGNSPRPWDGPTAA